MCRDIKTQSTEIPVYLRDIRVLSAEEATAREIHSPPKESHD